MKVIELMANSQNSWEEAARNAVTEASKTLHNIKSVYVKEHSAVVKDGKIVEYRVTVNLTFEVEEHKLVM
jgi:flavin-binding protein dodecin